MKTIDLGSKPQTLEASTPESPDDSEKIYYPSLYLSFDSKDEVKDLPESGEATIKYKVVSRTVSERNGKSSCSIDLEIHSITPSGKSKKDPMDEIEEGLQKEENNEEED